MIRQVETETVATLLTEMAKRVGTRTTKADETFGSRLRQFRNARGITQLALGRMVGLSQRMVAYYEVQGGDPGPELLSKLAEALGVTADALVGRDRAARKAAGPTQENVRLWRRFKRLTELPPHDRKTILKMIVTMADARRKAS